MQKTVILLVLMAFAAAFGGPARAQKGAKEPPTLGFPTNLKGKPGDMVVVPLNLRTSDGLEAADIAISYDTTRLEVLKPADVTRGTLTADFDLFLANVQDKEGTIRAGMGRSKGPIKGRGAGSLLKISFHIKANAPAGPAIINLQKKIAPTVTGLNDGNIPLVPPPEDKAGDPCDGVITVVGGK
jgi:hypothetical protein